MLSENHDLDIVASHLTDAALRGELRFYESMAKHGTWRSGGKVDYYYAPSDIADLSYFLSLLPDTVPILMVGRGSNLLVRDGGFSGALVVTEALNRWQWLESGKLFVECGVPAPQVSADCAKAGFTGVEFLAGIPGSIGGVLAMNAGAFGYEIWQFVDKVKTIDRRGELMICKCEQFAVSYRHVYRDPQQWFVGCTLSLDTGVPEQIYSRMQDFMCKRRHSQPIGQASCGSVFVNPPNDHAARLIEVCGLKGYRVGGVSVSEKHANFIINDKQGSATDIERLIETIHMKIKERFGIDLKLEVQIVGSRASVTEGELNTLEDRQ